MHKKSRSPESKLTDQIQEDSSATRSKLLRKKPWSEDEDSLVKKLVEKYGPQRWSFIAKFVEAVPRALVQPPQPLHPQIRVALRVFFLVHMAHGSKWAEMTKMLPGRSDYSIKNHWEEEGVGYDGGAHRYHAPI
jgi:hypothetical protein